MKKSYKIFILIFVVTVVAVLAGSILMRSSQEPREMPEISQDTAEFTEKIQSFAIENIGQPIEGFNADIYLWAFPGLVGADFDGVETREGIYSYRNGKLVFKRTRSQQISSAEEMILERGHETMLRNLRARLGGGLSVDAIIGKIVAQGLGTVRGMIFRGPICPVVKDPPEEECADQPVFGTFIVKDIAGINEIARFSTERNGSFSLQLPADEYSIESETPLGLGIQSHRIEVQANKTSEYTITFDTGIR